MANSDLHIGITADADGVKKGFAGAVKHTQALKKDIEALNKEIQEQRAITVEFQTELNRLREKLAKTSATDIKQTRALKKEMDGLTSAIRDNKAGVSALTAKKVALGVELKSVQKHSNIVSQSMIRLNETARTALPSLGGLVAGFTGMSVAALVADGVMSLAKSIFAVDEATSDLPLIAFNHSMKGTLDEMNRALEVNKRFIDSKKAINDAFVSGAAAVADEGNKVKLYFNVARDLTQTYENRKNAILQLQQIAPRYFNNFTTETILTEKATAALASYNKALVSRIQAAGLLAQADKAGEERARAMGELLQLLGRDADKLDFALPVRELQGQISELLATNSNEVFQSKVLDAFDLYKYYTKEVDKFVNLASGYKIDIVAPSAPSVKTPKAQSAELIIFDDTQLDAMFKMRHGMADMSEVLPPVITNVNELTGGMDELTLATKEQVNGWLIIQDEIANANKEMDEAAKKQARMQAVADGVSGAFAQIGDAISQSMMDGLGDSATAMDAFRAQIIETIFKLAGLAMANAITGATASGAATGPAAIFTTPAFISAAIGGVTSAFAAAAAFKPTGFTMGGVIPGNSRTGDRLLAPVNSGEVVLNTGQQNELLRMANGRGGGTQELVTRIDGRDLMIILKKSGYDYSRG